MSYNGIQVETLLCQCASTLERNLFVDITKSTGVAAYSTYGSDPDGVVQARSDGAVATAQRVAVYLINSMSRTFTVKLNGTVGLGNALVCTASGKVKTADFTARSRKPMASSEATATTGYIYLVPATPTSGGWGTGTTNANAKATYSGSAWEYVAATTGTVVYITDEGRYYIYNGSAYVLAKVVAYANEAGVADSEIEAYIAKPSHKADRDSLPELMNSMIVASGQSVSETDADASVIISDSRVASTDTAICTIAAQAGTASILKAACTTGTITVTLSGNGGAGTIIHYAAIRSIA